MNADFVAAILEGFEGTLDEVIERVVSPALRADLEIFQNLVATTDDRSPRSRPTFRSRARPKNPQHHSVWFRTFE
jgi:hypothetical protein